jgi:hypothetical protein
MGALRKNFNPKIGASENGGLRSPTRPIEPSALMSLAFQSQVFDFPALPRRCAVDVSRREQA